MNVLSREKQIEVIVALCEGVGIRTASRRGQLGAPRRPWLHGVARPHDGWHPHRAPGAGRRDA